MNIKSLIENQIFLKGILSNELRNIKMIPLIQLVQQNQLLPTKIILKLMYQLTIILNTIHIEGKSLENLKMEDLQVKEFGELDNLDIFIPQSLIKQDGQKNQSHLLNLLKHILIQFGLNPFEVNNFKSYEEILIYILGNLDIDLQKDNWREQILQVIYGFEIKDKFCYNQDHTDIFHVKVPYYIKSSQDQITIKWIIPKEIDKRLTEVDNYKNLRKSNEKNNKNLTGFFCYNLEIKNSTLLYLQKYSMTLKEYSLQSQDILTVKEKIKICSKLANELKNLHNKNKIHRDLKPENIMVTGKDIYKDQLCEITEQNINKIDLLQWQIIDFESTIEKGETDKTDDFRGTPMYLPPENMSGKPYDESYDIWQMGMCFLDFMTLENPKYTNQKKEKREAHIMKRLEKLKNKENKTMYSETMHRIISEMISFDPKKRPQLDNVIKELNSAILY